MKEYKEIRIYYYNDIKYYWSRCSNPFSKAHTLQMDLSNDNESLYCFDCTTAERLWYINKDECLIEHMNISFVEKSNIIDELILANVSLDELISYLELSKLVV